MRGGARGTTSMGTGEEARITSCAGAIPDRRPQKG
jgi:hypothetical protein